MATGDVSSVRSIEWRNGRLFLLDQTQLPLAISVEEEESVEDVWHAIKQLKVRGAPAIGVAGAYGLVVAMRGLDHLDEQAFLAKMRSAAAYLDGSRPTAVNLSWALGRVVAAAEKAAGGEGSVSGNSASGGAASGGSASEGVPGRSGTPSTRKPSAHLLAAITAEAEAIHGEDIEVCRRIGEFGAPLSPRERVYLPIATPVASRRPITAPPRRRCIWLTATASPSRSTPMRVDPCCRGRALPPGSCSRREST
jgi:methylthioribose-1-phosphate isomerase